jgi:TrmH family RNA methyltransferase
MRSCVAFGKKTIVCVEGVDPWNPKVIQASAGTIGSATIFTWSWQELLRNKKNLTLCALVVHGGKPPHQITITETLMVIGNEAHGIPQEMLTTCDELLTLPMPGQTESLNAAVAGSIGMYSLWVNT